MINLVIGRRELGKTTLGKYLASARQRTVIIDPRAQWVVDDPYEVIETDNILTDLDASRPVVVQPQRLQASVDALAAVMNQWLSDHRRDENVSLAVLFDEAGLYNLNEWDYVMRCSPRQQTSIILTAHRPADISTTVRSIADRWCIFRMMQRHDLDVIEERCGALVAERVTTLEPYQFVTWDDALGTATEHLNPTAWREPRAIPLDGAPLSVIKSAEQRPLW